MTAGVFPVLTNLKTQYVQSLFFTQMIVKKCLNLWASLETADVWMTRYNKSWQYVQREKYIPGIKILSCDGWVNLLYVYYDKYRKNKEEINTSQIRFTFLGDWPGKKSKIYFGWFPINKNVIKETNIDFFLDSAIIKRRTLLL